MSSTCGREPEMDKEDVFSKISGHVWTGPEIRCHLKMPSYNNNRQFHNNVSSFEILPGTSFAST